MYFIVALPLNIYYAEGILKTLFCIFYGKKKLVLLPFFDDKVMSFKVGALINTDKED